MDPQPEAVRIIGVETIRYTGIRVDVELRGERRIGRLANNKADVLWRRSACND